MCAFNYDPRGRQGVSVAQPQSGIDFPLVSTPSAEIRYLLADVHLTFDDPADYDVTLAPFLLPFSVAWLTGLGTNPTSPPDWSPTPAHAVDLVIRDANGDTVFDSTQGVYTYKQWNARLDVHSWQTATAVLRLLVHTAWDPDDETLPRDYDTNIVPTYAVLDERCVRRRPPRLRSITVITDTIAAEEVEFVDGFNVHMTDRGATATPGGSNVHQIQFDADPGAGEGVFPGCTDPERLLRTITGVPPDDAGDFLLQAESCYWVRVPTTVLHDSPYLLAAVPNTLQIGNDCQPCCPCEDFVDTAEYMNRVGLKYQAIGNQAQQVKEQMRANFLRWSRASGCCVSNQIQLVVLPVADGLIDIAGSFFNISASCIGNVTLSFAVELIGNSADSESSFGSAAVEGELSGLAYIRTSVPNALTAYAMGGEWPLYTAQWDAVNPHDIVTIRFRLAIPCSSHQVATVTLTGTASSLDLEVSPQQTVPVCPA